MWPRSDDVFAFRRRPYWSRLAAVWLHFAGDRQVKGGEFNGLKQAFRDVSASFNQAK